MAPPNERTDERRSLRLLVRPAAHLYTSGRRLPALTVVRGAERRPTAPSPSFQYVRLLLPPPPPLERPDRATDGRKSGQLASRLSRRASSHISSRRPASQGGRYSTCKATASSVRDVTDAALDPLRLRRMRPPLSAPPPLPPPPPPPPPQQPWISIQFIVATSH